MKIVKSGARKVKFDALNTGDVFERNTVYYMAICAGLHEANAINLYTGATVLVDYDEYVSLVDCELVIK